MFLFAEGGEHHVPLIVEFINHYLGEPVHEFQMHYTKPVWDKFFSNFGTDAEAVFGIYTVQNAIPWYTVMFLIACILSIIIIRILIGKLSEDDPKPGQMTLEAGFLAIKDLVVRVVGPHGYQYFPIVATFAVLILVSNLMGLFPMFMAPTAAVSVTFALAITSFIYYNYVGIHENGFLGHIRHFAGPKLPWYMFMITALIFSVELISNMIRPFTLGVRLFANMFADEKIFMEITNLYPPITQLIMPLILTALGAFVALVQTLVFTLLSMIYISEVSHPHEEHHDEEHQEETVAEPAAA